MLKDGRGRRCGREEEAEECVGVVVVVGAKREQARESCDTGAAGRAERLDGFSGIAMHVSKLEQERETEKEIQGRRMDGGDR